ncbi:hypothetical protein K435DRAFT_721799 [Dendrothele bispora CBS 962.96]|uniref:non-specific serine/threonine protein kinase n=1 Tax=Dendrothele bispora (strain CBS 962.96) TaxID=1314807 RepID=A0A4S8M5H8_DENBC|nr:hypothetical protein K435DRAFT_721799 [Dendrothele bispora CBS 962.96]
MAAMVELPVYAHSFSVPNDEDIIVLQLKQGISRSCTGGPRVDGQRFIGQGRYLIDQELLDALWTLEARSLHFSDHPSAWSSNPPEEPVSSTPSVEEPTPTRTISSMLQVSQLTLTVFSTSSRARHHWGRFPNHNSKFVEGRDKTVQTDNDHMKLAEAEADEGEKEFDVEGDVEGAVDVEGRRGGAPVPPALTQGRTHGAGGIPGRVGVIVAPSTPVAMSTRAVEPQSSLVVSDTVLGYGSHGTMVYAGSLQGRAVAVKRLLSSFATLAVREIRILQESDDHPNVVRYYYEETTRDFIYLALDHCLGTLAEVVERYSGTALNLDLDNDTLSGASTFGPAPPDSKVDLANIGESVMRDPTKALAQITKGLRHLHALKLVHRDIKPQNILVKLAGSCGRASGGYSMLISDFGLCKKLDMDKTSFFPTAPGSMAAGTTGWRAPEILRRARDEPTRLTKSVDIFSLGCLFYYVLTGGGHPFGNDYERDVNIFKDAKCLDGLERGWKGGLGSGGGGDNLDGAAEEGTEAAHLIRAMLEMESANRPDTERILLHPFFWDSDKRLTFLIDASDRFEIMPRGDVLPSKNGSSAKASTSKNSNGFTPYEGKRDHHLIRLENGAYNIIGADWRSKCGKVFIDNLGKNRKYDGKSVQDLLRALRNKKHHYLDLPENVKGHLGSMPEGYLSYFTRRFPRLFLHVYQVIDSSELKKEEMFRSYFKLEE